MPTRRLATPAELRDLEEVLSRAQARRHQAETEAALLAAIDAAKSAVDTLREKRYRLADVETIAATLEGLAKYLRATQGAAGRPTG
jgi:hypothetical protein